MDENIEKIKWVLGLKKGAIPMWCFTIGLYVGWIFL